MNSVLALYLITILAWGFSWYALNLQVAVDVPVLQSIFYRFILGALFLFTLLASQKKLQRLNKQQHIMCGLLGTFLFCINYISYYHAAIYLTSGLLAIFFALTPIANCINAWLWFRNKPTKETLIGVALGLIGITIIFLPDLQQETKNHQLLLGIILSCMGTFSFSIGNMLSIKIRALKGDLVTTTSWAMLYGSLITISTSMIIEPQPLQFDWAISYIGSLAYLVVIGSIVAFLAFLQLINLIGADKASFSTLVFPLVALMVSSVFEDYTWGVLTTLGLALVTFGNFLTFSKGTLKK